MRKCVHANLSNCVGVYSVYSAALGFGVGVGGGRVRGGAYQPLTGAIRHKVGDIYNSNKF